MGEGKCSYGNGRGGQGEEGEELGGRHVESGGRDCGGVGCCQVVLDADDGEKNRGNREGSCHLLVLEVVAML